MVHELTRPAWRKSTYSANNVQCVEFAEGQDGHAVRDSKNPTGPMLTCSRAQWIAFTAAISRGQFG
ncbi:MAG: DUF397 domain-containing protein [Pseudonocardiaceae bacterium]